MLTGQLGAAVLYATHEPELTDFYAGLGTLSPDGISIPTPAGFICHSQIKGYRFSVKPLCTGGRLACSCSGRSSMTMYAPG